jgi:DNA-binding GntR family transcriptional regulator
MSSRLKPLVRSTALRDQVYERLRESIRAGRIRPGERLQEIALAAALGVSRTPVREALALLARDGLATAQGRGFVVSGLSADDIDDIFELRRLLEPAAARDAAGAVTPTGVAALRAAVAASHAAHDAGDVDGFMAANAEFRAAWLALVPNQRLVRAVRLYDDHVESLRVLTLSAPRVRLVALAGLAELTDAIAAGDGERAASAMSAHLAKAEAALREAAVRAEAAGQEAS